MCLKILEILFVLSAVVLTTQLITLFFGITKKMEPMKASAYVSAVAMALFIYVVTAIGLAIFLPSLHSKLIMLVFAISPFLIGKVASYPKLKIFSIFQILCVIMSCGYILTI